MVTMVQKRRTPRWELSFPVLVETGGEVKRHMAANVSEEGMLFHSPEPYMVGTVLKVTFGLPSTDLEFVAESEVIHVAWIRTPEGGHFRTGLRFREFDKGELHPPLRCLPC